MVPVPGTNANDPMTCLCISQGKLKHALEEKRRARESAGRTVASKESSPGEKPTRGTSKKRARVPVEEEPEIELLDDKDPEPTPVRQKRDRQTDKEDRKENITDEKDDEELTSKVKKKALSRG